MRKPFWELFQFVLHLLLNYQQRILFEHLLVRTSLFRSSNLFFVKESWPFLTSDSSPSVLQIRRAFQLRPFLYHPATMPHMFVYPEHFCFCLSWITVVRCMNWFDLPFEGRKCLLIY
uniref:Uncharacterized protein n=1 Tax=Schistocephalus solidus TaxID=70667 RepID=A0A0X3NQI2_SCHSO